MRRREFMTLLAGAAAAARSLEAHAQQAGPVRPIGVLMGFAQSDPAAQSWLGAFRGTLTKLGWNEGGNLRIELRWAAGDADRMRALAKELVDLRLDAIFGVTTVVIAGLARETQTVPIVFTLVSDPIGSGFAASFAHPGGNITGFTVDNPAIGGKWMELLQQIAPRTVHAALLFNPATSPQSKYFIPSIQAAASSFGVQASAAPVHAKDEIEGVIAAQARDPGGGLIVMPDTFNTTNRDLIIAMAARYNVPAVYNNRYFAEAGGLISYGSDFAEQFRQAAGYIDRILKGAKPGGLPIQLPTKFALAINLKTAKALGLAVSSTLLMRADAAIE
jgi:putative tryptophan/tyrosine transport system substrate-binding protein